MTAHAAEAEELDVEGNRLRRRILGLSCAQLDAEPVPGEGSRRSLLRDTLEQLACLVPDPTGTARLPDHGDAAIGYQLVVLLEDCRRSGGVARTRALELATALRRALA